MKSFLTFHKKESKNSITLGPAVTITGVVVIYFLAQVLAALLVVIYASSRSWDRKQILHWLESSPVAQFSTYLLVAVIGIGLVFLLLRLTATSRQEIGLRRPRLKDVFYALIGYGWYLPLYLLSTLFIGLILPVVDFEQRQQLGFDTSIAGPSLILVGISLVAIPAIYEEVLFRGLLFTGLRKRLSLIHTSILISSIFAAAHLQLGAKAPLLWAAAADTFVLSLVLVYLRERTGSLWPAIGLHAIKNFVAFLLLFVFKVG